MRPRTSAPAFTAPDRTAAADASNKLRHRHVPAACMPLWQHMHLLGLQRQVRLRLRSLTARVKKFMRASEPGPQLRHRGGLKTIEAVSPAQALSTACGPTLPIDTITPTANFVAVQPEYRQQKRSIIRHDERHSMLLAKNCVYLPKRSKLDEEGRLKWPFMSVSEMERKIALRIRFARWVAAPNSEAAIKLAPGEFVGPSRLEDFKFFTQHAEERDYSAHPCAPPIGPSLRSSEAMFKFATCKFGEPSRVEGSQSLRRA